MEILEHHEKIHEAGHGHHAAQGAFKSTKRIARGYRSFINYRLRLLLNHGLIEQDQQPARVRPHRPKLIA